METKRVLITAGSTIVPIDQVRALTNIFKGRTGTNIASAFVQAGWEVTLLTSNHKLAESLKSKAKVVPFRTYGELAKALEEEVRQGCYDVIIHSAAVSDYLVEGVFAKSASGRLEKLDSSGKVSSSHEELFMRMVPTKKLIDQIRRDWGFTGKLVKFKLEVGINDVELKHIAWGSMNYSKADYIVANCLEWSGEYAYILGANETGEEEVRRDQLANALLRRLK